MKFLSVCFLLFLMKGCFDTDVAPRSVKFNTSFTVSSKSSVTVENELGLSYALFEENRCPEGVQCIRAGELFSMLKLTNKSSGAVTEATFCVAGECLTKGGFSQRKIYYSGDEVNVGGNTYKIYLQDFTPKSSKQSPQPESYSLTLLVEK